MAIVIVKNNTASSVFIEDLGIAIPGSGQRNFSTVYDFSDICDSEDLLGLVANSTLVINDGTVDLTVSKAIDHLNCKNDVIAFEEISGLFNVQTLQSDGISSTTSLLYQDKLTVTISAGNPIGHYIIIVNADFQATNNNKQVAVRLYDKTNAIAHSESIQQTNNSTNWFSFANHEDVYFNGITPLTLAVQFRNVDGTTCNIRNCNMSLWRVA